MGNGLDNQELIKSYNMKFVGIVQGVGFRSYVYKTAENCKVVGWVKNCDSHVECYIKGKKRDIKTFIINILTYKPILAQIKKVLINKAELCDAEEFKIVESELCNTELKIIASDTGVCQQCLLEMNNQNSKMYGYELINCINCGPRYSIINEVPYDRKTTAMTSYKMCTKCESDFNNKENRRYHHQLNACNDCGPKYLLYNNKGEVVNQRNPIETAKKKLKDGKCIVVKSVGGYYILCDAKNDEAIAKVRLIKNQPERPLAVMVKKINYAVKIAEINKKETNILLSKERPIVLLKKKENKLISNIITPKINTIGLVLPYSPIQDLLLDNEMPYCVMTSANPSGIPLIYQDNEVLNELGNLVDYYLIHPREIVVPVEDSIVRVVLNKMVVYRLGRGFVPFYNDFDEQSTNGYMALGADEKSSITLSYAPYLVCSGYIGDVSTFEGFERWLTIMNHYEGFFIDQAKGYIYDKNPDYNTTRFAIEQNIHSISTQHHHSHMVSCMVEHKLYQAVIGVIFDYTGMGDDGVNWGCEFFVGDRGNYIRAGHLKEVTLQGENNGINEPYRICIAYLKDIHKENFKDIKTMKNQEIKGLEECINNIDNCFVSTSIGGLFDAVAALLGICTTSTYKSQTSISLEMILNKRVTEQYEYCIELGKYQFILLYEPILLGIIKDIEDDVTIDIISAKFHNTIISAAVDMVIKISKKTSINTIVLSGDIFQNKTLLEGIYRLLVRQELDVYFNERIPINDEGISIGQIAIGSELLKSNL